MRLLKWRTTTSDRYSVVYVRKFCDRRIWSTATTITTSTSAVARKRKERRIVGTCNKDPCVYAGFLSEESLSLHHSTTTTTNQVKIHKHAPSRRLSRNVGGGGSLQRFLTVRTNSQNSPDQPSSDNILRIKTVEALGPASHRTRREFVRRRGSVR